MEVIMLNLAVRNTNKLIREKSKSENVRLGRLFTKKDTARLMAGMLSIDEKKTVYTILDPGAGTGILAAAAIEEVCKRCPSAAQIFITAYENNPIFLPMLKDNLERIRKKARHDYGVKLYVTVYEENYLTDSKNHYTVSLFDETREDKFDLIICNPPLDLIDKYSPEMQNPDITKPAGAGDVPQSNYKMIAALGVKRGDLQKADLATFPVKHGLTGWAPTQGHIPSGVPYLGFAREDIMGGKANRVMIIGKGSLFLGRMTNLFDGVSFVIQANTGAEKAEAGVSEEQVKSLIAKAMKEFAATLLAQAE